MCIAAMRAKTLSPEEVIATQLHLSSALVAVQLHLSSALFAVQLHLSSALFAVQLHLSSALFAVQLLLRRSVTERVRQHRWRVLVLRFEPMLSL